MIDRCTNTETVVPPTIREGFISVLCLLFLKTTTGYWLNWTGYWLNRTFVSLCPCDQLNLVLK